MTDQRSVTREGLAARTRQAMLDEAIAGGPPVVMAGRMVAHFDRYLAALPAPAPGAPRTAAGECRDCGGAYKLMHTIPPQHPHAVAIEAEAASATPPAGIDVALRGLVAATEWALADTDHLRARTDPIGKAYRKAVRALAALSPAGEDAP